MSHRYLSESRDPEASRIDVPGQTFAILGLATLTLVLVEARTMAPLWTTTLAIVTAASIALFIIMQRRASSPMLPLHLLRSPPLIAALVATLTMTFGIYGMLMVNSFVFQQERGDSPLATAVQFLPMPLTYLALIPVVNMLVRRTGPRLPMVAGLGLMGAAMLVYAAAGPDAEIWLLETGFVLAGAGLALNTGPAVGLAMSSMPLARTGLAAGVVNLARLVGITVGVAVLGTMMAAGGVRAALLCGGVVELVGGAVALRWAVGTRGATQPAESPTTLSHKEHKETCHA
jgi:MFS family permease